MKAADLLESTVGLADDVEVPVTFPPGVILVTGAIEVTAGALDRADGKIYLVYTHPHLTVGGTPELMEQEVGSYWITDSDEFVLA